MRYIPTSVRCDPLDESSEPFYTLRFRLIRLKLPGGRTEVLVTSLSQEEFSPDELKKLYGMRWGIETSFRELKHTVGLLCFHGKKAAFIRQEIFARLILYLFTESIANRAASKKAECRYAYCVRFKEAVYICRELLRGRADPELVEPTIARFVSPIRPGRSFPRKMNPKEPVFFVYRAA